MGACHARGFIAEGANVVIGDLLEEQGAQLADELGDQALFVNLDVTDESSWEAAVAAAEQRFGPVSTLINNAGIERHGSIADGDPAVWRAVIDINLTGTYLGMRAVVPSMRRRGGGAIVNISSAAGMSAIAGFSAYVSSKWALRGLTRSAARELATDNIRVNSVHPGLIRTPMADALGDAQQVQTQLYAIPRPGEPEEVTSLVLFIASEDASFSTGSEFTADGGFLLGRARSRERKAQGAV